MNLMQGDCLDRMKEIPDGSVKPTLALITLLALTSCTLSDSNISTSASNYVRVTECNASVPLYGGVSGCQVSSEGKIKGTVVLSTENCNVSISE